MCQAYEGEANAIAYMETCTVKGCYRTRVNKGNGPNGKRIFYCQEHLPHVKKGGNDFETSSKL